MKEKNEKSEIILGIPLSRDYESLSDKSGKARFYGIDSLKINNRPGKRLIIPALGNENVTYTGDGHLMTIAPTGSGKGRGVIIPNLLTYEGSVFVIDPKGENYKVTAQRRKKMGQEVYVLDPFRVMTNKSDSLNPLDIFNLNNSDIETDSQTIADLLSGDNASTKEPFWDINAKGLLSGLITYLADPDPDEKNKKPRSLRSIKELLMDGDAVYNLAVILDNSNERKKKGQRGINEMSYLEIGSFTSLAEVTRTGILSTANSYTKSFSSERVSETLDKSSFSLQDIVDGEKSITIYIIIPPDKLKSHRSLLKLWVGTLLKAISSRKKIPTKRTLFILDECGQLGTFPFLETAITLLRGYGLQTWTFWQDLSQLKKLYEIEWSTMVNNCAVLQIFGTNNYRVASEFSEMIGVDIEQVSSVRRSDQILLLEGEELLKTKRFDYLNNPEFKGLYTPNPFYEGIKPK